MTEIEYIYIFIYIYRIFLFNRVQYNRSRLIHYQYKLLINRNVLSESITALHPLVVPFALRQNWGSTGNGSRGVLDARRVKRRRGIGGGEVDKGRRQVGADFFSISRATRLAYPCEPRTLWRLQNISGPGTFTGNAKLVAKFHAYIETLVCEENLKRKREEREGRKKDGDKIMQKERGEEEGETSEAPFSVTKDAQ